MRIAFLNPQGNFDPKDSYWAEHPDFGGQLVYVKEVAIELADMGHVVDIFTRKITDPDWPEFGDAQDAYPGVPNLRILRIPCGPEWFLLKEELWPYLATEWVPGILAFYREAGHAPDVYTTHYGDGGLSGSVLHKLTGIPYSFTAHSLGAQKLDKLYGEGRALESLEERFHFSTRIAAEQVAINRAAAIITSTQQERNNQYQHPAYRDCISPEDGGKFAVIPPGVNIRIFSQQPEALDQVMASRIDGLSAKVLPEERRRLPVILSASRFEGKKNIIGLIKAFAASSELQSSANILLSVRAEVEGFNQERYFTASENPIIREIHSYMQMEGLAGKVFAVPINGQAELAAAYRVTARRKSVFVLLALYEPFGLAPLEAMACGLPAVVTKNGGPSESMREGDLEFGVLVDPQDSDDIVLGLLRLLNSAEEWEAFQAAGIARVLDKYTWRQTARDYEKVLKKISGEGEAQNQEHRLVIPEYFFSPVAENSIPIESLNWLVE